MSKSLHRFIRYQLPALVWALMIYIASSIPSKYLPAQSLFAFDKVVHLTLYFVLGILIYRALEPLQNKEFNILARIFLSISIVIFYGVMDEFHQGSVPGRTLDLYDAIADTVGGILAGVVIFVRHRKIERIGK